MSAIVLNLSVFLAVSTLGFALMLFGVSMLSYWRLRNAKLAIVGAAFGLLAVKGALATHATVVAREADLLGTGLDFAVLALLYVSVAKR